MSRGGGWKRINFDLWVALTRMRVRSASVATRVRRSRKTRENLCSVSPGWRTVITLPCCASCPTINIRGTGKGQVNVVPNAFRRIRLFRERGTIPESYVRRRGVFPRLRVAARGKAPGFKRSVRNDSRRGEQERRFKGEGTRG